MFQTEYKFKLPKGYVDDDGNLHKEVVMRLATAADEILPQKDPRVQQNPAYISVILFSRVLTQLGSLNGDEISTGIVEKLFASDLSYLQEIYNKINGDGTAFIKAKCPKCEEEFEVSIGSGE